MKYSLINEVWNPYNIKENKKLEKFSEKSNKSVKNLLVNSENKKLKENLNFSDVKSCNNLKNCDEYIEHILSCKKCLKKMRYKLNIIDKKYLFDDILEENKDVISTLLFAVCIVLFIKSLKENE